MNGNGRNAPLSKNHTMTSYTSCEGKAPSILNLATDGSERSDLRFGSCIVW
jgi:hypothetical protein